MTSVPHRVGPVYKRGMKGELLLEGASTSDNRAQQLDIYAARSDALRDRPRRSQSILKHETRATSK
jgi:hypothetical protein